MGKHLSAMAAMAGIVLLAAAPSALAAPRHCEVAKPSFEREIQSLRGPQPAAAALTGAGVIEGTVRDFSGAPLAGALVAWMTADFHAGDLAYVDANGFYQFSSVPAITDGQLWFTTPSYDFTFIRRGLTFADPGPNTFDCWPGRLPTSIKRGGPWANWRSCDVNLFGADAVSSEECDQPQPLDLSESQLDDFTLALPGSYTSAVFMFRGGYWPARSSEALEVSYPESAPAVVSSGETSAASLLADESQASRTIIAGWASGSPGSYVTLRLAHFPAGYILTIKGQSMNGKDAEKTFRTITVPTPAPALLKVKLRVPSGIPLGDYYVFEVERAGGKLWLTASFQACSLVSTKTSIRKGTSIRLSGRVPFAFDPMHPNRGTTVTLFRRRKAATQPASWSATGWTKVMTLKTTDMGRFVTPALHPGRTTWYVVRYPASNSKYTGSFWRGFTSVRRVRVY